MNKGYQGEISKEDVSDNLVRAIVLRYAVGDGDAVRYAEKLGAEVHKDKGSLEGVSFPRSGKSDVLMENIDIQDIGDMRMQAVRSVNTSEVRAGLKKDDWSLDAQIMLVFSDQDSLDDSAHAIEFSEDVKLWVDKDLLSHVEGSKIDIVGHGEGVHAAIWIKAYLESKGHDVNSAILLDPDNLEDTVDQINHMMAQDHANDILVENEIEEPTNDMFIIHTQAQVDDQQKPLVGAVELSFSPAAVEELQNTGEATVPSQRMYKIAQALVHDMQEHNGQVTLLEEVTVPEAQVEAPDSMVSVGNDGDGRKTSYSDRIIAVKNIVKEGRGDTFVENLESDPDSKFRG